MYIQSEVGYLLWENADTSVFMFYPDGVILLLLWLSFRSHAITKKTSDGYRWSQLSLNDTQIQD